MSISDIADVADILAAIGSVAIAPVMWAMRRPTHGAVSGSSAVSARDCGVHGAPSNSAKMVGLTPVVGSLGPLPKGPAFAGVLGDKNVVSK